ncbi:hypothetical Protein YC6258_02082 [Gynuella sunshinyii YC6258]|uniref:Uncharacterized protein n=2 Tax=Gynuella sunshinyii TaxID=1445505 RepID=A0A0C5VUQ3_9GAMM|nr:hypothetical Protein YC6258_02082 [Gynuella sunshinyii YC6258]
MQAEFKGAFSGAAFGGIAGAYGNSWDMSRVGANGLAGGVTSNLMEVTLKMVIKKIGRPKTLQNN